MMRNWKLLGLSSLVTLALASAPAPAGGTDGVQPQTDRLKSIHEDLQELKKNIAKAFERIGVDVTTVKDDLKTLKANDSDTALKLRDAQNRITDLGKVVNQLRLDIDTLRKKGDVALYPPPSDKAAFDEIKDRLGQIEQALERLKPAPSVKVGSSPAGNTGRLVLVNAYTEELLFLVNQKPYRVTAGATAILDNLPAGTVTYEVISPTHGLRARNNPFLEAGKSIIITAR